MVGILKQLQCCARTESFDKLFMSERIEALAVAMQQLGAALSEVCTDVSKPRFN
jgi:hypothetical protein